MKFGQFSYK